MVNSCFNMLLHTHCKLSSARTQQAVDIAHKSARNKHLKCVVWQRQVCQQHNTDFSVQAGDASGTGLFDTANRTYDSKRLGSIDSGLEDKFPQLIGPNEVQFSTQSFCYGWNTFMFVTVTAMLLPNIAVYHGSLYPVADSVR